MKGYLLGLSFSAVFIVGVAVGILGDQGVRVAQAQAGVAWEYLCDYPALDVSGQSVWLNETGAQGWELIGEFSSGFCFKRPL